jgi:hypothetical protein
VPLAAEDCRFSVEPVDVVYVRRGCTYHDFGRPRPAAPCCIIHCVGSVTMGTTGGERAAERAAKESAYETDAYQRVQTYQQLGREREHDTRACAHISSPASASPRPVTARVARTAWASTFQPDPATKARMTCAIRSSGGLAHARSCDACAQRARRRLRAGSVAPARRFRVVGSARIRLPGAQAGCSVGQGWILSVNHASGRAVPDTPKATGRHDRQGCCRTSRGDGWEHEMLISARFRRIWQAGYRSARALFGADCTMRQAEGADARKDRAARAAQTRGCRHRGCSQRCC